MDGGDSDGYGKCGRSVRHFLGLASEPRPVTVDRLLDGRVLTFSAPPRKEHQGRDRHTKGPREDRTHTGPRSRAPGAARGGKGAARGGARGGAAAPAGEKKPTEHFNNDEGKAELTGEFSVTHFPSWLADV